MCRSRAGDRRVAVEQCSGERPTGKMFNGSIDRCENDKAESRALLFVPGRGIFDLGDCLVEEANMRRHSVRASESRCRTAIQSWLVVSPAIARRARSSISPAQSDCTSSRRCSEPCSEAHQQFSSEFGASAIGERQGFLSKIVRLNGHLERLAPAVDNVSSASCLVAATERCSSTDQKPVGEGCSQPSGSRHYGAVCPGSRLSRRRSASGLAWLTDTGCSGPR